MGANSEVPFETIAAAALISCGVERLYAVARRTTNSMIIEIYMAIRRNRLFLCVYAIVSFMRNRGCRDIPFAAIHSQVTALCLVQHSS